MSKASQSIIIITSLLLLVGASGCGLQLVTQPGAENNTVPEDNTAIQQVGGRGIAEQWIKNSAPTYKFDGENLNFTQSVALRCGDDSVLYEFTFDSRNGGYGNRVNEALDNIKTTHTIRVTVGGEEVSSAITDERYNEMTGQFGEPAEGETAEERCL